MSRTRIKRDARSPGTHRWQWATVLALLAALIATCTYVLLQHQNQPAVGDIAFQAIEVIPEPPIVTASLLQEVQRIGKFGAKLDPGQAGLLESLRAACLKHPWVKDVERLETLAPGRLQLTLRYREPIASLQIGKERYLLDDAGVRLPWVDGSVSSGVVEIQGVERPPLGRPGEAWGSSLVVAAARLARLIAQDRTALGLVAIEIDDASIQPEVRLRSAGGTRIIWQRWPADLGASVSEDEKLRRLHSYVEHEGSLDKPAGPYVIDVRPLDGLLRRERPK
jgi:hypothetical protein